METSRALAETLDWAKSQVPYYARRIGRVKRLEQLPFLTKREAIRHRRQLLARGTEVFSGVISSGTSGDSGVLRVPRLSSEEEANERSLESALGGSLLLEVRPVHHGVEGLPERKNWLRVPWASSRNALRLVESVLARPVGGQRVRRLLIHSGALLPLTVHLLEVGRPASRFKLKNLWTGGFRLSKSRRAWIEKAWGAPVRDFFSLSEVPSPAVECGECGHNHWVGPPMVTEVLDPNSRKAAKVGVLVLTTLYPFVQAMPLLRYWTDDVVELGPVCGARGERGIRFRGRLADCLVTKEGLVFGGQEIEEALEPEPMVARHAHPMERLGILPPSDCGRVKWELKGFHLRVELKFDPKAFPEEGQALGHRVAKRLVESSRLLARLERQKKQELEIELVGPGAMASDTSI